MRYLTDVEQKRTLSWPVGMLLAPVVVLFTLAVALYTCLVLVGFALAGRMTVTWRVRS